MRRLGASVNPAYRGRIAPSPTGQLHLGHARTFWVAHERAKARGGTLILRNEDLDRDRVRPEFVTAFLEDLRWFGIPWQEGPDCGGPQAPYSQSERRTEYQSVFEVLRSTGWLFPYTCSRKDIQSAVAAPPCGGRRADLSGHVSASVGGGDPCGAAGVVAVPGA